MNKEKIKKIEGISIRLLSSFIFDSITEEEVKNFSIISVTGIKISSDLLYLDIFISSLKNGEKLPKSLAKHGYDIQKKLNKALSIRCVPKIRFRHDSSGFIAEKLTKKINKLKIN